MTDTLFQQPASGLDTTSHRRRRRHTRHRRHRDGQARRQRRAPRSLQVEVGPSELGTPCMRRLAYKILDESGPRQTQRRHRPLGSQSSARSVHAWMAQAYVQRKPAARLQRYLIEHRVHLPYGISGSCDLYDRDTGRPIDWKITSLDNIPSTGRTVPAPSTAPRPTSTPSACNSPARNRTDVAIAFLPRGGRIDGLYIWSEPYDPPSPSTRSSGTGDEVGPRSTVDPEAHPGRWELFPTADAYCTVLPDLPPWLSRPEPGLPRTQRTTS